jgi:hypothetical protein
VEGAVLDNNISEWSSSLQGQRKPLTKKDAYWRASLLPVAGNMLDLKENPLLR